MISEMPVLGLTYGQAMQIKEDAYELGIDTVISVHGAEFHFFQKKNGMIQLTSLFQKTADLHTLIACVFLKTLKMLSLQQNS